MWPANIALKNTGLCRLHDLRACGPKLHRDNPVGRFTDQLYPIFLRGCVTASYWHREPQQHACNYCVTPISTHPSNLDSSALRCDSIPSPMVNLALDSLAAFLPNYSYADRALSH